MPIPIFIGIVLALASGLTVLAFWKEIKIVVADLSTALYKTAKRSKNALKMIAKGFAEDNILNGEFTLIKKGSAYILETFVYEFQQTPAWKFWKSDELEKTKTYSESKMIEADKVPNDIKQEIAENLEIRKPLELAL